MRLIDADKTKVYTYELDKQVFVDVITRFISLQPTVKAIPVEWIKDKMDELEGTGRFELSEYLVELLADWEKENEEMV